MKIIRSKRMKRFLYILGFEFKLIINQGKEEYHFEDTDKLNRCMTFYYEIRRTFEKENNK